MAFILNLKEEQYISDFSFIFFLFNFLSKINKALKEIINKAKYNLTKLYEKYELDENYKGKINQYIEVILNISISKKPNKKCSSKSSTKDNSNGSLEINNISIEQILINDLLGKAINNGINSWKTKNVLQSTPRFNDHDNNISYFEENKNNIKRYEENNIPLLKKNLLIHNLLYLQIEKFSIILIMVKKILKIRVIHQLKMMKKI